MNCVNHPDAPVTAYCRSCGRGLCAECRHDVQGTVYCAEHVPAAAPPPSPGATVPPVTPPVYVPNPHSRASPGLAFCLGFIPGVGAIYNGQYAKGVIHAVVFGLLVSIMDSHSVHRLEPLIGILLSVWVFYMAFEAYHTAAKRRNGEPVDELSSLVHIQQSPGRFPLGPIILIAIGLLLLLDTMDIVSFDHLARFWPALLILLGVYMLYGRLEGRVHARAESTHDRR